MLAQVHRNLEWLLEWVVIILMVALTVVVIVGVCYRIAGNSLSWYDEVASVQLAWITYYGAAMAALKRRHIGFATVLLALPPALRKLGVIVGEAMVIGFFALMAWAGMEVLTVLAGLHIVSITWVPTQLTHSVLPIGAHLCILCARVSLTG